MEHTVTIEISVAANASDDRYVCPPGAGEWYLERAYFTPATAVAEDAADYAVLTVYNGATSLGAISTEDTAGTGAWTAGTPVEISLLTSEAGIAARQFTGGTDAVKVTADGTAGDTGAAVDGGLALVFRKLRS